MKIIETFPPNIEEIRKHFPNFAEHEPLFCYGDTIYNPFKTTVTKDLEIHEEVHSKQQGEFPDVWYFKYFNDIEFRLQQELEAYGTQLAWVKKQDIPGKLKDWKKEKIAQALSGSLYGNLLSYAEAESKIRNFAKTVNL